METLRLIATLLPLAVTSGINLYGTVLVAGLLIRLGWVSHAPAALDVLGSTPILVLAGVCFTMEFFADKIQFVDNVWDAVHTTIRPIGAALLGVAVIADVRPELVVVGALLTGGVALISHGGKAGSRLLLNLVTPYENVTNIFISLLEDAGVGVLTYVALQYPWYAAAAALIILLAILIAIPILFRWFWFTVRAVGARLKGWRRDDATPAVLPAEHQALLGHRVPELALPCRAQNLRAANGRAGHLSFGDGKLAFTWRGWFGRPRLWSAAAGELVSVYRQRRLLYETLVIHYRDAAGKEKLVRFVFLKDRPALLDRFAAALAARPAG